MLQSQRGPAGPRFFAGTNAGRLIVDPPRIVMHRLFTSVSMRAR